jgi:hypothetical protein
VYPAAKDSLVQGWSRVTDSKGLKKVDWSAYLREHGMRFPKGDFACYYPAMGVLIVANTPDELHVFDAM